LTLFDKEKQMANDIRNGILKTEAPLEGTTRLVPSFNAFQLNHPWVGEKIGKGAILPGGTGYIQQYQHATAYANIGGEPHEVHGAIRDKYDLLGGPAGPFGFPLTDESPTPDGVGRFNHFEGGSIYFNPAVGTFELHGAIRDKWATLGYERGWLGYPTSDELDLPEGGRVNSFQNGCIYFWPDTGAIALKDVVVQYTGIHCFGVADFKFSGSDNPYAAIGFVGPDNLPRTISTRIYAGMPERTGIADFADLYRGRPRGMAISIALRGHGEGDVAGVRNAVSDALAKGGEALATAAARVPTVGPVLGPVTKAVADYLKDCIVDKINTFIEENLGLGERPLGSDLITVTLKQMVVLATRHEGNAQFNEIPWRFETALLDRFGASYKLYFNIFPS
jgi:hypothetical protein